MRVFFVAGIGECGICDYVFYAASISTAKLPDGLYAIGASAFRFCPLYSVNLPESLTVIGECAFAHCRLILVTLPQNLQSLGDDAATSNYMLTRLVMTQDQIDNGMAPEYIYSLSFHFKTLSEADESAVDNTGNYIFWKDENARYWLMGYTGNENEITLPATVNGNKYTIHTYAFSNTELNKITFEDTSDWQCKYQYNAPTDMTVSDPEQNAKNLQESYVSRE
ncbi:MAG: leucine-rich repeat domain-containing protein [Clostridiales bacterium]|nr:leucine-rich repeat domain-containing protein [Clostridiales bacterium]